MIIALQFRHLAPLTQDPALYGLQLGVVMDYDPSDLGLLTIQIDPYIILAQNCIRLEPGSFRIRRVD